MLLPGYWIKVPRQSIDMPASQLVFSKATLHTCSIPLPSGPNSRLGVLTGKALALPGIVEVWMSLATLCTFLFASPSVWWVNRTVGMGFSGTGKLDYPGKHQNNPGLVSEKKEGCCWYVLFTCSFFRFASQWRVSLGGKLLLKTWNPSTLYVFWIWRAC